MTKSIDLPNIPKLNIRSRSSSREKPATLFVTNAIVRTNSNNKLAHSNESNPSTSTTASSGSYSTSSSFTDSGSHLDANNNSCHINHDLFPKLKETEKFSTPTETRRINATSIKYGELVILGYNGSIPNSNSPRRKSKFVLKRRDLPNGVKPASQHFVQSSQEADVSSPKNKNIYN